MARVSIRFTGEPTDANRASESVERGLEGVSKQAVVTRASLAGVWGDTNKAKEFSAAISGIDVKMGGLGKSTRDVNQGFALMGNVMGLLKWPAMISAAGLAAQALSVLAGGAVALAGALGPLTGLLGAIPAGLGAIVASAVTVKLAFSDLKEALAGNAEAIKRLTPEARAFGQTLAGLKPIIEELRKAAQQGLFPGLEQALKTVLTRENLAAVKAGLTGVGQALGDAAVQIAKVLGTKQFAVDLNLVFKQFESIIRSAGVAGGFFVTALMNIMVAAKPLIDFLNQSIIAFAKWTADATSAGRATGDLQKFFEGTVTTMKQLGAILGPLGSALVNIFKAAKPLTDAILKDLAAVTKEFAAWTASASGQNALAKYFTDVKEPLYEMARLIRDVVKAFFELGTQPGLTNLLRQIRTEMLPAIVELISTTTRTLGPALIDLFTNAAKLMTQLAGATGPLIALVKILGGMAGALADFLEQHDEIRSMVTSFASMVAITKAISFAAAITGARALATSLGLVSASSKGAAAAITTSSAAEVAALRAVAAQAGLTTLALRGVSTSAAVSSAAAVGSAATLTAALGKTRVAAVGVGAAFGPWGIAIAAAVAVALPYLDNLERAVAKVLGKIPGNSGAQPVFDPAKGTFVMPDQVTPAKGGTGTPPKTLGGGPGMTPPGKYGYLQSGTSALAAWTEQSGGTINAGQESGHSPTGGHGAGESLDIAWDANGPTIWAALFAHRGKFRLLLGPPGLYMWGNQYQNAKDAANHKNHIHVQYQGSAADLQKMLGDAAIPIYGSGLGDPLGLTPGALTATGGAAAAPKPISPAQVALGKVIGGLKEQAAALTDDIPEIARALTPKLEALYDKLGDKALSAKALANIKAAGVELRHALSNLIQGDELRDKLPNLRATIGAIADDETRAALKKRADELAAITRGFFKDGFLSDKELATLEAQTKKLNAIVSKAFGKDLQDQIKTLRGQLNDLFAKGFIDEASLDKAREALDRIPAMYARFMKDGVIGPKERQALAQQLDIAEEIVKAGQDAEKAAEKAMGRVKETFRNLFADGVVSDADLALLSKAVAGIGGKIGEGMQAAVAAVEKGRQDFDTAWSTFRSAIERAFSEQVIGKFQLTIDMADAYEEMRRAEVELSEALKGFNKVVAEGLTGEAAAGPARALKESADALAKQKREYADAIADLGTLNKAAAIKAKELVQELADAQADYAALGAKATEKQIREALQRIERLQGQLANISDDIEDKTLRDAAQKVGDLALAIDKAQVAYDKAAKAASALSGALDSESQAIVDAIARVRAAQEEYYAAIISQDTERIKKAVDEKIAANAALKALDVAGLSERAQAIMTAGQQVIAAEAELGRQLVAEQKRIWEETKTVALAGVLAVVDEVGGRLRDGKITWAQAVGEIGTALTAAGMDAGSAADLLGSNISSAMGLAARAIETAVAALTKAINALVAVMGGAVTTARGHVQTAQELYNKIMALGGATDAEARRIANAAVDAGVAEGSSPSTGSTSAGGKTPGASDEAWKDAAAGPAPSDSTSSGSSSSSGSAPPEQPYYDPGPPSPYYSDTPGSPGYKKPLPGGDGFAEGENDPAWKQPTVPQYAIGGVVLRKTLAMVAEKFPEAIIPLPQTMDSGLRRLLIELAEGGWRRPPVIRRPPSGGGSLLGPGGLLGGGFGTLPPPGTGGGSGGGAWRPGWAGPEHAPPRFVVAASTLPAAGGRRGGFAEGENDPAWKQRPVILSPTIHIEMPNYIGSLEDAARELVQPIRRELDRIGRNNGTDGLIQPFGGR